MTSKIYRLVMLTGGELHQVGRLYRSVSQAKAQRTRKINRFRNSGATRENVISYSTRLAIQESELDWKGAR